MDSIPSRPAAQEPSSTTTTTTTPNASSITDLISKSRPNLDSYESLYKHFHANPELSNQEKETAATIASHLRDKISSDFDIRTNIGGTGIAALLFNGEGPTVLLRADFDALPVEERTGLEYASKKRMVDADGVEKPVMPLRTGVIGTRKGLIASAADSMRITLHGRGGHASMPDRLIDPVVMAASTIMKLQTIVSREVESWDSAVVTVASVQAGDAENVVADNAHLAIDVRTINPRTREKVKASIERIVKAESVASNAVAEPTFKVTRAFPLTVNDDAVTGKVEETFKAHFGHGEGKYTSDIPKLGGSEDFSILGSAVDRPYCFFMYGGTPTELWDKCEAEGTLSENIPINHSGLFYPAIQPTLSVATDAYTVGALTWLLKK